MLRKILNSNLNFNLKVYTDIRITQHLRSHMNIISDGNISSHDENETYVIIRIYDGYKWFSITRSIDITLDLNDLLYEAYSVIDFNYINERNIIRIKSIMDIHNINQTYSPKKQDKNIIKKILIKFHNESYSDIRSNNYVVKSFFLYQYEYSYFISSLGSHIEFVKDACEIAVKIMNDTFQEIYYQYAYDIPGLLNDYDKYIEWLSNIYNYNPINKVDEGFYNIILANKPAGLFIHECIGHLSEADLALQNNSINKLFESQIKVGIDSLNVIDNGSLKLAGWTPFDNEGIKSEETYIIKSGYLNSMLHSIETAITTGFHPTGNSRSVNAKYNPIVRMTNTYLDKGDHKVNHLISNTKNGIYIDSFSTCYGYQDVFLKPNRSYYIRDGKISSPVMVPTIKDNAITLLNKVVSICDDLKFYNSLMTGCSKGDQILLPVGIGSPHIELNDIHIKW